MSKLLFILLSISAFSGAQAFDIELAPDKVRGGTGQNMDSPDFFNAFPATEAMLFVTAKSNWVIEVWKYPYDTQFSTLSISGTPNGVAVDGDRLYVGIYGPNPRVEVYALPSLGFVRMIGVGVIANGETNLDVLHLTNGDTRVYVSDDTPRVLGFDVDTGQLEAVIDLSPYFQSVETVLCDDFHQRVLVPDEDGPQGVHYFDPDGTHGGSFGAGRFQADAEGITLYNGGNGEGYVIVADQKNPLSEFEFFDRKTHAHLGVLKLTGVNNTDGIALTHQSSPLFPVGAFAAIDDDATTALISWETVLEAIDPVSGVKGPGNSLDFVLEQNYPNPFNPSTTIEYRLPETCHAKLVVYNLLGQEVSILVDQVQNRGTHRATFNVSGLISGVYFYRLEAGEFVSTRKMVVMK